MKESHQKGEDHHYMGTMKKESMSLRELRGERAKEAQDQRLMAETSRDSGETVSATQYAKELAESNLNDATMLLGQKSIELMAHMVTEAVGKMMEASMKQLEDRLTERLSDRTEIVISQKLTDTMMVLSGNMTHLVDSLIKQSHPNVVDMEGHRRAKEESSGTKVSPVVGEVMSYVSQRDAVLSVLIGVFPGTLTSQEIMKASERLTGRPVANVSAVLGKLIQEGNYPVEKVGRGTYRYKK